DKARRGRRRHGHHRCQNVSRQRNCGTCRQAGGRRLERRLQATVRADFCRRPKRRPRPVVAVPARAQNRQPHHRSGRGSCRRNLCLDQRDPGSLRRNRQGAAAGCATLKTVGATADTMPRLLRRQACHRARQVVELGAWRTAASIARSALGRNAAMKKISRRAMLAGTAGLFAMPRPSRAQGAKPRLTVVSQWSAGSDGAAITALGKKFEEKGGTWQHSPVPGFTTEMMNKLRAQIMAGDPPACSQLKGREIGAWSKIAATVDLDALVAAAGYEKVVAPDLARLHKPGGKWISLPLQIYSTNMLFLSK